MRSAFGRPCRKYATALTTDPVFTRGVGGRGGSGRAKVLDKRLVLGRPASLDNRRARTYCACSKYG